MAKVAVTKKNKSTDIRQDIRHLGVVIESVNDNVKLVAEQHGDIKKDINGIKYTLNSHTEMIGNLAVDMTIVKMDITAIRKDIEIMKSDIEFIKGGLKKKVDIDEFSALERRVLLLEKRG